MNWETIHKNIGNVIVGKKQKIIFKATDSLPEIKELNSSCGCSIPRYDSENKVLTVTYKPGSIPIHRQIEGWYTTTKEIIVTYKNGERETLGFTAIVRRR